jgi:hypothetical protein
VVKGGNDSGRQQVTMQANRMKIVSFDGERPVMAVIVDLNADTITQVDYRERRYTTATMQDYAQIVQGATAGATPQMAGRMKEMEEALRNLPPEQRKMAEQMMGARMPQAGGECRVPTIDVRKVGPGETIAGYATVRYDVTADARPQSRLWIAPAITAGKEMDAAKLRRFGEAMAKLASCGAGVALGGTGTAWQASEEGYPVRTVDTGTGATVEVVKAQNRSVTVTELGPPAGFAKKSLQELMGR